MSTTYTIQDTTLASIANNIREQYKEPSTKTYTPMQMANRIQEFSTGPEINLFFRSSNHVNVITGEWERPNNWPDIDALADEIEGDQDCVYLTYDLSTHPDFHWIGIYVNMSSGNNWYLDRYDEGEFVHTHLSANKNAYIRYDLTEEPDNNTIQVWRLTSDGHISQFGFATNSNESSDSYSCNYQPCVQRAGTLPWCIQLGGDQASTSPGNKTGATIWLERDALVFGTKGIVTTLTYSWVDAWNLQSLDFSKLDTKNWEIATLTSTFSGCYSLKKLDLSFWDTSNWEVVGLSSTFYYCYSLEQLNLNSWDTSNWKVTNLQYTWNNCQSLQSLLINEWDTENWIVNTLAETWSYCQSLKELDLNSWDTSNWAVTSLYRTWTYCYALNSLKINNWNTSKWCVTSLSNTWNGCFLLKKLNLNSWDTSNWDITTLSGAWCDCYSLQELNIDKWDTENWSSFRSFESAWSNCWSLKKLDLNSWDTSNWKLTTIAYLFNNCYSLKELNINEWDTSSWAITSMSGLFYWCQNLSKIDIKDWDTSNWALTSASNTLAATQNLKELYLPASFNFNSSKTFTFAPTLAKFLTSTYGTLTYEKHSYSGSTLLTKASLNSIISRLPTITSSKTITLGQINTLKLTAADIAVATNKGWTVA